MTSQPNPIPHLIDAVTALGFALRELGSPPSLSTRQDGLEHLTDLELLSELISRRLTS